MGLMLSSMAFVCISTVTSISNAVNVREANETFFIGEDEYGNSYKCFTFKDVEGHVVNDAVSIAWADLPANTPKDLVVGDTISYDDDTYHIKGIAKHGFRYCDFESIDLSNNIESIAEEAFAYCTKLKTFNMPYPVTKIAPSTFLDCRSLETVRYYDENKHSIFSNDQITEIGDHAFDSCVSLRDFYSPTTTTLFGNSAFKNCSNLVNFFFPSEIIEEGVMTNKITVKSYAFADCKSLIFVYFETNMDVVENYAFVDCHSSLRIKYTGNQIPNYANNSHWRDINIASNINNKYPVDYEHSYIHSDPEFPYIRYSIENKVVPLDSAQGRTPTVDVIPQSEVTAEGSYAVIYKFDTPRDTADACYNSSTGALVIPNTIDGKTVKIIKESAFANNMNIKSITFNKDLVQICNRAFFNCLNIENLDFTACKKLVEVSYFAFHDTSTTSYNDNPNMTSLILPDCLQYIGGYAFCKFYNVNEFSLPANVKAIDDLAFYQLGFNITYENANVNLLLPKSLNDQSAKDANFKHISKGSFNHNDYTRFYAVGKYAFNEAKCLQTVTMEDDDENKNDNDYSCSFYSNCFNGAENLIRFQASTNLKYLGKDSFKGCTRLKEMFLTTAKSDSTGYDYPWCIDEEDGSYGGTLFFGSIPELVCYLDGPHAPGILDTLTDNVEHKGKLQINSTWNAETSLSYTNDIRPDNALMRSHVPTYRGVNFKTGIKYWNPKTNGFVTAPVNKAEYSAGVISIVKDESTKYKVARYYYDVTLQTGYDYIDLTDISGVSSDLVEIGEEAFAKSEALTETNDNRDKQPGCFFLLPDTITKIAERAFYRNTNGGKEAQKNNARYGARVVTYKDSATGKFVGENGTTQYTLNDLKNVIKGIAITPLDVNKRGFCVLPSGVTYIGNVAFYNHIFRTVRLPSSISYFGNGAFYVNPVSDAYPRGLVTTIGFSGNSDFSLSNNGIYYSKNSKKLLISQANGVTGTLTIASGTNAIGFQACASTQYDTINLNSELTTIYGNGFARNKKLKTVNNTESLKYIASMKNISNVSTSWTDSEYQEVWEDSFADNISISDYRDYTYAPREMIESMTSAFYDCQALETFNFKAMTNIRKIGKFAFYNCTKMYKMSGNVNYVYKEYSVNDSGVATTTTVTGRNANNQNVLDLSSCTSLRSIAKNAFVGCDGVKFLHLPNNRGSASESNLYIGYDPEAEVDYTSIISKDKGMRVLVGETAEYAHHDFGKAHNAQVHYNASCFNTGNKVYYYVASAADVPADDSTALKYWTKNGSGEYILIANAIAARKYFGA